MDMLRCEENATREQRVGICMRDPAVNGGLRYHAGIVATPRTVPPANQAIEAVRVAGGLYAVHLLVGPVDFFAATLPASSP